MNRFLLFMLFAITGLRSFAEVGTDEKVFSEASHMLVNGENLESIRIFEDLYKKGQRSPALYGNLASAYHKTGQKGKAVLFIERGLSLAPFDAELINNRNVILSAVTDNIIHISGIDLLKLRVAAVANQAGLFTVICILISSLLFLLSAFFNITLIKRLCRFSLFISIALLAFWLLAVAIRSFNQQAVVVSKIAYGKTGPGYTAKSIITIREGEKVQIEDFYEGWYKVKVNAGNTGWVPGRDIEMIHQEDNSF